MAEPALDRRARLDSLRGLLDTRFPGTTVLDAPRYGVVASGLALDELLPGGLPRGAVTLLTGGPSCGKTGAALACAASWTGQGGTLAWLHDGALSAPSAAHARVDLGRCLHVRGETTAQLLRCLDYLLRWQAFGLVVVDWTSPRAGRGASWNRLMRLVTGSRTALLVLAPPLPEGDPLRYVASVHIELTRRASRGGGAPVTDATLLRSRYGHPGGFVRLAGGGMLGAPFPLLPDLPGLGQDAHDEP